MKVIIRQVADGEVEQVFSADNPFDIQIRIGEEQQLFRISHDEDTAWLRIRVDGRLVIQPEAANSICLTEVK